MEIAACRCDSQMPLGLVQPATANAGNNSQLVRIMSLQSGIYHQWDCVVQAKWINVPNYGAAAPRLNRRPIHLDTLWHNGPTIATGEWWTMHRWTYCAK